MDEAKEGRMVVLVGQLIMSVDVCVRVRCLNPRQLFLSLRHHGTNTTKLWRNPRYTISYALILVFMSAIVVVEKQGI